MSHQELLTSVIHLDDVFIVCKYKLVPPQPFLMRDSYDHDRLQEQSIRILKKKNDIPIIKIVNT